MHPSLTQPPAPGTPEARVIIQAFIASRCQFRYTGHGSGLGERCTDLAVWPKHEPRYCCPEHARGGTKYRESLREIIPYQPERSIR